MEMTIWLAKLLGPYLALYSSASKLSVIEALEMSENDVAHYQIIEKIAEGCHPRLML